VLFLDNNLVSDISPLAQLNLVTLNISENPISNFDVIGEFGALESFEAANTQFADMTLLSGKPQLKNLDLSNTAVIDFSSLSELTQLEWLVLDGTSFSQLDLIDSFTNLTVLSIGSTKVTDFGALASLSQLEYLDLDDLPVENLTMLLGLEKLKRISLKGVFAHTRIYGCLEQIHELKSRDVAVFGLC
jgi:internalin A